MLHAMPSAGALGTFHGTFGRIRRQCSPHDGICPFHSIRPYIRVVPADKPFFLPIRSLCLPFIIIIIVEPLSIQQNL